MAQPVWKSCQSGFCVKFAFHCKCRFHKQLMSSFQKIEIKKKYVYIYIYIWSAFQLNAIIINIIMVINIIIVIIIVIIIMLHNITLHYYYLHCFYYYYCHYFYSKCWMPNIWWHRGLIIFTTKSLSFTQPCWPFAIKSITHLKLKGWQTYQELLTYI